MPDETLHNQGTLTEDVAENAGARTTAINTDPTISLEETQNAAAGEGPSGSGGQAPSTVEEHIPSTSEPYATDIPSANAPDPQAANPDTNPNAAPQNPTEGTGVTVRGEGQQHLEGSELLDEDG